MKFAYADPPYLGCCQKYQHYHPDGFCWNDLDTHRRLIDRLMADYSDGWALSLTVPSLWDLLPLIPKEGTRICQWSKTFSAFRKGVRPAYAWEPIIVHGGRNPPEHRHAPPDKGGKQTTPKDFCEVWEPPDGIFERITMKKGLTGAKPEAVCNAILDWLNVLPEDTVDDLYVGTGVMGRVLEA